MKKIFEKILRTIDLLISPFVCFSAVVLKTVRWAGVHRLPFCKKILLFIGVFPIRNHYYEPLFDTKKLQKPLSTNRNLPGINWNEREQLQILDGFHFSEELKDIPRKKTDKPSFYLDNGFFGSGDIEYWYNIIRFFKPKTIIEIGGGFSTLLAIRAIRKNEEELPGYHCEHICIEPFEMPRLEESGVSMIRKKVEDVGEKIFEKLNQNDVLFIDSSHVIRPQGDVLFEYLEILPKLKTGVIVHIHDIFSPKDYIENWVKDEVRFYNEQYLLEAFLTENKNWKIIGALNFLRHNHYEKLQKKCLFLTEDSEPGSFYMQRVI